MGEISLEEFHEIRQVLRKHGRDKEEVAEIIRALHMYNAGLIPETEEEDQGLMDD